MDPEATGSGESQPALDHTDEDEKQPTILLEIYEFPEDTKGAELTQHFFEQCQAQCKTSDTNIDEGRKTTHIFSMEFLQSDAQRILEKPEQLLDEDDEKTKIKIRSAIQPAHTVLFHCTTKINQRMVKKSLKKFEIIACKLMEGSDHDALVIFKNAEDAVKLVTSTKSHRISSTITASVSLHRDEPKTTATMSAVTESPSMDGNVVSDQLPSENILSASSDLVVHSSEPSLPTDEAEPKRDALEKGHPSEKTTVRLTWNDSLADILAEWFREYERCTVTKVNDTNLTIQFDNAEDAQQLVKRGELKILTKKFKAEFCEPSEAKTVTPKELKNAQQLVEQDKLKIVTKKVKSEFCERSEEKTVTPKEHKNARKMVGQDKLKIVPKKVKAEFCESSEVKSVTPKEQQTHIEINSELVDKLTTKEVHGSIADHLKDQLEGWTPTKYEQSYDEIMQCFRFDMTPEEIGLVMSKKQTLQYDLQIKAGTTGNTVVITRPGPKTPRLSRSKLKGFLGPRSSFAAEVTFSSFSDDQAILELETCSVACKLVTRRLYELKDGSKVQITFPPSQLDGSTDNASEPSMKASECRTAMKQSQKLDPSVSIARGTEAMMTLLVHNVLGADEETLYYWFKSISSLWPASIHLSESGDGAVVKIPLDCTKLDWEELSERIVLNDFHLHGKILRIEKAQPSTSIQVTVSSTRQPPIQVDILESYFSRCINKSRVVKWSGERSDLFIITIPSDLDVTTVTRRKSHNHAGYNFEVAEYYKEVGLCKPGGPILYSKHTVAEKVYNFHQEKPIFFNGSKLDIELDCASLLDHHDNLSLRVSGLTPELDPEKLKFYLSALSDNVITDILLDDSCTKAVAKFCKPLDFGLALSRQLNTRIKDCPDLSIHRDDKPEYLLAVGVLTEETIEHQLGDLVSRSGCAASNQITAKQIEGTSDKWKIWIGIEAISKIGIPQMKQQIQGCSQLTIHSDFLGLDAISVFNKAAQLSEMIADSDLLYYLLDIKLAGFNKFVTYLLSHGFNMSEDGLITVTHESGAKTNRKLLQQWQSLSQLVDSFVRDHCAVLMTEPLTKQVVSHLIESVCEQSTNHNYKHLANKVCVVGDKLIIQQLKTQFQSLVEAEKKKAEEQTVSVPVERHHMEYLERIKLLDDIRTDFSLTDIQLCQDNQKIEMTGPRSKVDSAQNEMDETFCKIEKSKCSEKKGSVFLKVFGTKLARESLLTEFLNKRVKAVWTVENMTVSMYSESSEKSELAMNCLNDLIWEAEYPQGRDFHPTDKHLMSSAQWSEKNMELEKLAEPLQIEGSSERPALKIVGLKYHKEHVLNEINTFFEKNLTRRALFHGEGRSLSYIYGFRPQLFSDLAEESNVVLKPGGNPEEIEISGSANAIANATRKLQILHDSVRKGEYTTEVPAMMQRIKEDPDILKSVGEKTKCMITSHEDDEKGLNMTGQQHNSPAYAMGGNFTAYKVVLPSGVKCSVRRGDITNIKCDVIVNAANDDLQHCEGLALDIVQRGGDSIQQECNSFTRRQRKLTVGQAMSSDSGSLPCKKIIHVVCPRWSSGKSDEVRLLRRSIESCFEEMKALKLHSIAIPLISTDIFGFSLELAVEIIVRTLCELDKKRGLCTEVILVDNKDASLRCFEKELRARNQSEPTSFQERLNNDEEVTDYRTSLMWAANRRQVRILGRVDLAITSGDITKREEQSLVNSVGTDMNLKRGMVAPIISKRAGPKLQDACSSLAPIQYGEVKATKGYNMPCQQILHCCLPRWEWEGQTTLQKLQAIVSTCLIEAASAGLTSIAFPVLGTGNLKYPAQDVARCMIETAIDYADKNPRTTICDIKIVIFHEDKRTLQEFDAVLNDMRSASPYPISGASTRQTGADSEPLQPEVKAGILGGVNHTCIKLLRGKVVDSDAEIHVYDTDVTLTDEHHIGDGVWISTADTKDVKYIIRVHKPKLKSSKSKLSKAIADCLAECHRREASSIAFPSFITDQCSLTPEEISKCIWEAIRSYIDRHTKTKLMSIIIAISKEDMAQAFKTYMETVFQKNKNSKGLWTMATEKTLIGSNTGDRKSLPQQAGASRIKEMRDVKKEQIILDIYADSNANITDCKRELDEQLQKAFSSVLPDHTEMYGENMHRAKHDATSRQAFEGVKSQYEMSVGATCDLNLTTRKNQESFIDTTASKAKTLGPWTEPTDIYQEIVVDSATQEFKQVDAYFLRTIGSVQLQYGVIEVRRVQNPSLYELYGILRSSVAKRLNKPEEEVETFPLWHGSDEDTVLKITASKFDRGLAGKSATVYGSGSYFARDSSYSCGYATPNQSGEKFIILSRVITGEYTKGDHTMTTAPFKDTGNQYDSVVDNIRRPSMYVVFSDMAAYPAYIIKFK